MSENSVEKFQYRGEIVRVISLSDQQNLSNSKIPTIYDSKTLTFLVMCVDGYTIISGSNVVVRTAEMFTSFLKGWLGWFCDASYISFGVCFDELVGRSGDWVLKSKV